MFSIGDLVILKSGGVRMTIKEVVSHYEVICIWHDKQGNLVEARFSNSLLKKYEKKDEHLLDNNQIIVNIDYDLLSKKLGEYIKKQEVYIKNESIDSLVDKIIKEYKQTNTPQMLTEEKIKPDNFM